MKDILKIIILNKIKLIKTCIYFKKYLFILIFKTKDNTYIYHKKFNKIYLNKYHVVLHFRCKLLSHFMKK